ncbi:DHA2 family efflux MFS transporter permease subunit [Altericroceibacterium endophyticum]|uniref:DHA2 family efflux MFS transporter permease subunit n=1 Tax=Altericroceibacterium endophyticum TaxID=1808508 RepID=A0A6I4T791_9SPHN|nr:DHA2 family efflux MFS transporter permease subunit [Altericroceibacterium endophyticum]MXO66816.1 DHA2 family efflux MFS transporter permease subunit [Altericroceibacterium endophyticum]
MAGAAHSSSAPMAGGERERASVADWLAVMAGTLGAMMATLDISIVNSALPTIQGNIGASGTEGTWIATSYLVAEIIIIPLCGWLERLFGLRTFLLVASFMFTGFSILCGTADNLTTMIIGRAGQGFTGGAMIPTAMTIIATRLPQHQQPIGTALFGVTAILGPVIGPLLGGWLTESYSWHYAFLINVPVCAGLAVLLLVGLPGRKPRFDLLGEADWLGIIGMSLGLGCLTVVLEEGHREQWFDSALIIQLTAAAVFGFLLLTAGQMYAKSPVIRLKLLFQPVFGSVVIMAMILGMVIYGTSYVIPQFLAAIADYNALQAGKVVMISGIPSLMLMPFTPFLMRHLDLRVAVAAGLLILSLSCHVDTEMNAMSTGSAFVESQLLRGVGTILAFVFLNQAAISAVPREYAGDASGLFNAARNLGGSFALAGIATIQDQRLWFHSRRIEETLSANSVMVQDYMAGIAQTVGGAEQALRTLAGVIRQQALVMAYNDIFWTMALLTFCVTPLVLLLKPLPKGVSAAPMH